MITFNYVVVQKDPEVKLHYAQIRPGNETAPLIIFLHGFPEYWYAWGHYLPHFANLGFHVVAPDMRGFNQSDKPQDRKAYDIKFLVNDIKNLIKSFNKEKAIIVGHDWGGAVTWDLALMYPEVCESIIVLNCPHRGAYAKNIRKNPWLNLKQTLRSWYIYFFQIPWLPEFALKCCNFKWARYNFLGWVVYKNSFSPERIEKYINALAIPGALTAGLNYYRANVSGDYGKDIIKASLGLKKFEKIKVPTLLIWAENDMALEKGLTYEMEEFFENRFELKYIPNCSHWVHLEMPEKVMELIEGFINQP